MNSREKRGARRASTSRSMSSIPASTRITRSRSGLGQVNHSNVDSSDAESSASVTRPNSAMSEPIAPTGTGIARLNSRLSELQETSSNITRFNSEPSKQGTTTAIKRSNSAMQIGISRRVTRSTSTLFKRRKLEEISHTASAEEKDSPAIKITPYINKKVSVSATSSIVISDDDNSRASDGTDVLLSDLSKILDNKDLTDSLTEQQNNDSKLCCKTPLSEQRVPPLEMDEDFDIHTFLGHEEVITTMNESSIGSDEDFLNQFPTVDVNKINQVTQPRTAKDTIIQCTIAPSNLSINKYTVTPSTSKAIQSTLEDTPSTSKVIQSTLKATPSNSKANKRSNSSKAIKRPFSDTNVKNILITQSTSTMCNPQVKSHIIIQTNLKGNTGPINTDMRCQSENFAPKQNFIPFKRNIISSTIQNKVFDPTISNANIAKTELAEYGKATSSPISRNIVVPCTSKESGKSSFIARKRCLDEMIEKNVENNYPKKQKIEIDSVDVKHSSIKWRSPLKNKDINNKDDIDQKVEKNHKFLKCSDIPAINKIENKNVIKLKIETSLKSIKNFPIKSQSPFKDKAACTKDDQSHFIDEIDEIVLNLEDSFFKNNIKDEVKPKIETSLKSEKDFPIFPRSETSLKSVKDFPIKSQSPFKDKDACTKDDEFQCIDKIDEIVLNLEDSFFKNNIKDEVKPKIETSLKSEKDFPIFPKSGDLLKDEDMSFKDNKNSDSDETDDEEVLDETKDYDFPNLAENIDFDVSAIKSNVHSAFKGKVGEKRMQTYLKEQHLTKECIERLYYSVINMPVDAVITEPRDLIIQLMPHQKHALKWMLWREEQKPSGGILADEMGLGKTIQMIALILASKNDKQEQARANGQMDSSSDDDDIDEDWGEPLNDDESRRIFDGKTLVVCPTSVLWQWEKEISSKCRRGALRVFIYYGPNRNLTTKILAKYDVVITTYNLLQKEWEFHIAPSTKNCSRLFKIKWERVVLDEAHYIRNHQTKLNTSTCELSAKSKWALTGTPIQNRRSDFYALLKFVNCSPFNLKPVWNRWVGSDHPRVRDSHNKRLKVITASLMLRRTKEELIEKGAIEPLPEKQFNIIEIELDTEEKLVYQRLLLYSRTFFNEFLEKKQDREHEKKFGFPRMRNRNIVQQEVPDKITKILLLLMKYHVEVDNYYILVLITRLRQMCCHPYLIKSMIDKEDIDVEDTEQRDEYSNSRRSLMDEIDKLTADDDDEDCYINDELARRVMSRYNPVFEYKRRGSKVRAVLDVVHTIVEKGEKVIVVSQWVSFLNVIANNLDLMKDANYEMFTGQLDIKSRQCLVDRLNDSDDSLNILLLSLTAGGVGLNLIGANNLLLIDLHWNPQLEVQAMDRIYRLGQQNNVHIYKFICKDTIEENIQKLQDMKLSIASNVLSGSVDNRLTIEDLKLLFS